MFIQYFIYFIHFLLGFVHLFDSLIQVYRHESECFLGGHGGFLRIGIRICQLVFLIGVVNWKMPMHNSATAAAPLSQ